MITNKRISFRAGSSVHLVNNRGYILFGFKAPCLAFCALLVCAQVYDGLALRLSMFSFQ